jgi:hypothetical protein
MNDPEIGELDKILEREVDEITKDELGPGVHTPEDLHCLALKLQDVADTYGDDPVRFRRADIAWARAVDTAEGTGDVALKEKLAMAYVRTLMRRATRDGTK